MLWSRTISELHSPCRRLYAENLHMHSFFPCVYISEAVPLHSESIHRSRAAHRYLIFAERLQPAEWRSITHNIHWPLAPGRVIPLWLNNDILLQREDPNMLYLHQDCNYKGAGGPGTVLPWGAGRRWRATGRQAVIMLFGLTWRNINLHGACPRCLTGEAGTHQPRCPCRERLLISGLLCSRVKGTAPGWRLPTPETFAKLSLLSPALCYVLGMGFFPPE